MAHESSLPSAGPNSLTRDGTQAPALGAESLITPLRKSLPRFLNEREKSKNLHFKKSSRKKKNLVEY